MHSVAAPPDMTDVYSFHRVVWFWPGHITTVLQRFRHGVVFSAGLGALVKHKRDVDDARIEKATRTRSNVERYDA